jgi:hypothetical protein
MKRPVCWDSLTDQKGLGMINAIVQFREPTSAVEAGLNISAVAALLLGSAVYLLDRDWAGTMLLTPFIAYQWTTFAAFGDFGGSLPSLLHSYAIPILIIAALRPWPWIRPWVCLLWFTIELILEWLQSDVGGTWFVAWEKLDGGWPHMAYLKRYSLQETFDRLDLLASGIGCLAALAVTISIASHRHGSQA